MPDIKYILSAEDKTSGALASASKGFSTFGKIVLAALPIAAVEEFARKSVEAAADAQQKMASFSATMATIPGSTDQAKEAILKAADATLKLGFDNEEAAVSLAKLYQRTHDVSQAIKLNNIAMDLARAKHIDLSTAGNLVGLVMSGNGKILKQYGIDLKEAGTPAQALAELQGKLAGQATSFASTFAGQMEVFKQNIGEVQESIGGPLLQVLNGLLKGLNLVIDALREGGLSTQSISADFQFLFEKMTQVWNTIKTYLAPLFQFLTAQIKDSWDMIKFYAPSIQQLQRDFETLKPFLMALAVVFVDVLGAALYVVIKSLTLLAIAFENSLSFIAMFYKGVQAYVDGIVNEFLKVTGAINSFVGATSKIAGATISFVSGKLEGKANGGPVNGGTPYLVGEQGPELFVPSTSGKIAPNSQTSNTINFGGITLNNNVDANAFVKSLQKMLGTGVESTKMGVSL